MSTDNDVARSLGSWLRENRHEDADRVLNAVFDQLPATPQRQPLWRAWRPSVMNNMVRVGMVTAAAVIVAIFGFTLLRPGGAPGGPSSPSGSPSPTPIPYSSLLPAPTGPVDILGLPPEGAEYSDPAPGELVLQLEGSAGAGWHTIWVYADGRIVWSRGHSVIPQAGDAFIGLVEQRLTPSGVEFLRSEAIATGLFDSDLVLQRDTPGYMNVRARNGDRLVSVTWWHQVGADSNGVPNATEEQVKALQEVSALLINSPAWPVSAWDDRTERAYVPSRFAIRLRGVPDPIEQAEGLGLLPQEAQALYRAGDPVSGASVLTTEDARALAEILERAQLPRYDPENGAFWLRYYVPKPTTGNAVWISFEPVLPGGEAVWLGPG
jgi:hypothetical protein